MRDTSRQNRSGTLTALALIAVGAVPVLAFAAWLVTVAGRTVALPGGGDVTNTFAPASGHAKALLDIGMFVLAVTGLIFVSSSACSPWRSSGFARRIPSRTANHRRSTAAHRSSCPGPSFR